MKASNQRHPQDVASILDQYGEQFVNSHQLCGDQLKAIKAIKSCRTAAQGGHVDRCDHCHHTQVSYNSCRNRHCNKCQYLKQLVWVDKLESRLPICRYYHVVYTLPQCLHKIFYINQRLCYNALFKASAQALAKATANPDYLGVQSGAVSVLHTWGQTLTYHPHIHMLVPAGGLTEDGEEWRYADGKFFVPVKVLSKLFRGILWSLIEQLQRDHKIKLPDGVTMWELKQMVYAKNWHVYIKRPLAGPQSVVKYLGQYTHRVAISNQRIKSIENDQVSFEWKNYRQSGRRQVMDLSAQEFIGRFLRHILPTGFYKIRYYGLLAPANKALKERCVVLLKKTPYTPILEGKTSYEVLYIVTGVDPRVCPYCKEGKMMPHTILDPV
jgi:hypothetical protein